MDLLKELQKADAVANIVAYMYGFVGQGTIIEKDPTAKAVYLEIFGQIREQIAKVDPGAKILENTYAAEGRAGFIK